MPIQQKQNYVYKMFAICLKTVIVQHSEFMDNLNIFDTFL